MKWYVVIAVSKVLFAVPALTHGQAVQNGRGNSDDVWLIRFDDRQVDVLIASGCTFSEEDRDTVNRMAKRGFTAEHFIKAYQSKHAMGPQKKADIESIATLNYVGMSPDLYYERYSDTLQLTEYYNRRVNRTGAILVGLGIPLFLAGGAVLGVTIYSASADSQDGSVGVFVAMVLGGVDMVAGLVMSIVGAVGMSDRAPSNTLESASTAELERYRLDENSREKERGKTRRLRESNPYRRPPVTFSLVPPCGKKPGGVGMIFVF